MDRVDKWARDWKNRVVDWDCFVYLELDLFMEGVTGKASCTKLVKEILREQKPLNSAMVIQHEDVRAILVALQTVTSPSKRARVREQKPDLGSGVREGEVCSIDYIGIIWGQWTWKLGRRVIERRGVFYNSRFVAHPVFPTPANVSCIVQQLRLKIVGLRRTGKN